MPGGRLPWLIATGVARRAARTDRQGMHRTAAVTQARRHSKTCGIFATATDKTRLCRSWARSNVVWPSAVGRTRASGRRAPHNSRNRPQRSLAARSHRRDATGCLAPGSRPSALPGHPADDDRRSSSGRLGLRRKSAGNPWLSRHLRPLRASPWRGQANAPSAPRRTNPTGVHSRT